MYRQERRSDLESAHGRTLAISLITALAGLLIPIASQALPVGYSFESGSAVVRGTLAGQSETIFEGGAAIDVPIVGGSAVFDSDVGSHGRLESLRIAGGDIDIDLDQSQVGLDTLSVFSPTITSLDGSDVSVFGQFSLPTEIEAIVEGSFPDGSPFGPVDITSLAGSSAAVGQVSVSGDQILISVVGVTIGSFAQVGNPDPFAPNIEIKADFTLIGRVSDPIPEPSAALLFVVGLGVAGAVRRSPSAHS